MPPCNDCSREENYPPCPNKENEDEALATPHPLQAAAPEDVQPPEMCRRQEMTAWNQLVGALIVKGYSERQALNMIWDLLHEEAERIKSQGTPKSLQIGEPSTYWEAGRNAALAELDPDDVDWQARCNHCYLPWSIDHVCHIGWYDWLRTNKPVVVDLMGDAVAQIDATLWKTRTPNEDDPMWVKYRTYGEACWEQLLQAIRNEGKKEINQAKETGAAQLLPVDQVGEPMQEEPECTCGGPRSSTTLPSGKTYEEHASKCATMTDQLPSDPECETRDARTCTTSCTVHGEPETKKRERYPKWCTPACCFHPSRLKGTCEDCLRAEKAQRQADQEAMKDLKPKLLPGEEIFDRMYRWVMQAEAETDKWVTQTVERTEPGAKEWLETKRRQHPNTEWRAVKETRIYTVEDM